MVQILLIEDDTTIAAGLAYSLEQEGWKVTSKRTLAQGKQALETGGYQLLLVDIGLPDGRGFDLCAVAKSRNIPIIFATAQGDEGSVVLGLDMGADDYIVKPFRLREVASRIRAVLRRAAGDREQLVRLGELTVDTQKGQVARRIGRAGPGILCHPASVSIPVLPAGRKCYPGNCFGAGGVLVLWPADPQEPGGEDHCPGYPKENLLNEKI